MKLLLPLFCFCTVIAFGQTPSTPCPAGVSNTPYSYFGLIGGTYDYYGKAPAVETGFGVKTGVCSNAFLVTDIATGVGQLQTTGYATLSEAFEYHLASTGNWEFIGQGLVGMVTATASNGTVTSAMFAGGFTLSYDMGWKLSKKSFHLPVAFKFLYTAITATQVKPTYGIEFRKTIGQ